jgi:hypothetical protein
MMKFLDGTGLYHNFLHSFVLLRSASVDDLHERSMTWPFALGRIGVLGNCVLSRGRQAQLSFVLVSPCW